MRTTASSSSTTNEAPTHRPAERQLCGPLVFRQIMIELLKQRKLGEELILDLGDGYYLQLDPEPCQKRNNLQRQRNREDVTTAAMFTGSSPDIAQNAEVRTQTSFLRRSWIKKIKERMLR